MQKIVEADNCIPEAGETLLLSTAPEKTQKTFVNFCGAHRPEVAASLSSSKKVPPLGPWDHGGHHKIPNHLLCILILTA